LPITATVPPVAHGDIQFVNSGWLLRSNAQYLIQRRDGDDSVSWFADERGRLDNVEYGLDLVVLHTQDQQPFAKASALPHSAATAAMTWKNLAMCAWETQRAHPRQLQPRL